MTATKAAAAPSTYVSGHCATGRHDACRGVYAGTTCGCEHHIAPPEPKPEVLGEIAAALTDVATAAAVQHCPTCTCGRSA